MHQPNEPAAPEAPRRRFRKLRIAWSVAWGVVAVLLIVLWVRSYSKRDSISAEITGARAFEVFSISGEISLNYVTGFHSFEDWGVRTNEIDDLLDPDLILSSFDPLESGVYAKWGLSVLTFSHCAPIFLTATLATLPWIRFRFSLRTLLIATTLVAAGLGLIAWLR